MSLVDVAKTEARRELDARKVAEEAEACKQDLRLFVRAAWPHVKPEIPYMHNWHIDAICDHLAAVSRGEIKRLQIWIPPQSMKSILTSVCWPAWEWTFAPGMSYWTASYSTDLSGRLSAMSLLLMKSPWYQERWGTRWKFIRDAEHFFGNDRGGVRLATSPTAETGTGYHGDRILIDDAINAKAADATSKAVLETTNDWYDSTVSSRGIGPNHARVIIMQRLHENDIAAHVMELEDWNVLCLPERYEPTHPYVWRQDPRSEDDLLWPLYRPESQSNANIKGLGHRASGQYQQRPAPKEGNLLKRHWWRFYPPDLFNEDLPARELKAMRARRPRCTMVVQSVDTPLRDSEQNDMVSIQAWGVKGADRFLIDVRTEHMSSSQAKRAIVDQARYVRKLYPRCRHKVLIESAGYGPDIIPDLKRVLTGVEGISPAKDGSKYMRADAASDALESGNCWLPGVGGGADETMGPARVVSQKIKEFIDSCAIFDNGAHDDDVDAWSQCMNYLRAKIIRPGRTSSPFASRRAA